MNESKQLIPDRHTSHNTSDTPNPLISRGGEFALLAGLNLYDQVPTAKIPVQNGDDAAVLRIGNKLLALSVDVFVAERHFSLSYSTPEQVGIRCVESACSDIVAMGGQPEQLLIALLLPELTPGDLVPRIYCGLRDAAKRLNCVIIGGDTVSAKQLALSVTAVGRITGSAGPCQRQGAQTGDVIVVSGPLGGAACGLELLRSNITNWPEVRARHLTPRCRIDLGSQIAQVAHAMIDISDGLSSELHHICTASSVGCWIDPNMIPIEPAVRDAAAALSKDPVEFALHGGEDFELLFTLPRERWKEHFGSIIGEITATPGCFQTHPSGLKPLLPGGWDQLQNK